MLNNRVVITGLGVLSPNGENVSKFHQAIKDGVSGVTYDKEMEKYNFQCTVSARPSFDTNRLRALLPGGMFVKLENDAVKMACLAGSEAWLDAGLEFTPHDQNPDWNNGIIFGVGSLSMDDFIIDKVKTVIKKQPRKIGSRIVEQTMNSGAVSYLNKIIGFGNIATSNSTACSTGTEAVILGYERIKSGKAKRMLCGSTEAQGVFIWSSFEALRILVSDSNDEPEKASRPMSSDRVGFVPGAGAGALVLEDLDTALERGANIYAEIIGAQLVNGGQRNGGSITASNQVATKRAISKCLIEGGIEGKDIDAVNGHLTGTIGDVKEIQSWCEALNRFGKDFPPINSLKSMIGHCLGASGSIEMVASVLQLKHNFLHPNINIDNIHPDIVSLIDKRVIVDQPIEKKLNYIIKASLGFGDVNSCILLKKWKN